MLQDLRHGARTLLRSPGFALTAILSLALGIGANSAIFQLLEAVQLRRLPVLRPTELAEIGLAGGRQGLGIAESPLPSMTSSLWEAVRDHQQGFSNVFAWGNFDSPAGSGRELRRSSGVWVSGAFFSTLGVAPYRGRLTAADDDRRGCAPGGVVLSYRYWQRLFGGRDTAIGQPLVVGEQTFRVIGVTPPAFSGLEVGRQFDVALPLCTARFWRTTDQPNYFWLVVMGRLKPGWTTDRADEHLSVISPALMEQTLPAGLDTSSIAAWRRFRLTAVPGGHGVSLWRQQYQQSLRILLVITTLVLLIICANVANLMLARATPRAPEFAVRTALGASRGRLIRLALGEGVWLAAVGFAIGLGLAGLFSHALVLFLTTEDNGLFLDLALNWRVLAFASGVSVATCLACGLPPAFRSSGAAPADLIKSGGRGLSRGDYSVFQRALVVGQIATSLVLVMGALLFVRSVRNLLTFDTGFRQDGLLFAFCDLSQWAQPPDQLLGVKAALVDRLSAIPGVTSAAVTTHVPLTGMSWTRQIRMPDGSGQMDASSKFAWVSPEFFRVMGMRMVAGRAIDAGDTRTSRNVVVVNEAFVRHYVRGMPPIGALVRTAAEGGMAETAHEIVGVVADARYADLREEIPPVSYAPVDQQPRLEPWTAVVLRTSGRPEVVAPAIQRVLADAHIPGSRAIALRVHVLESLTRERTMSWLSGFFGAVAVLLASVGLYGLMSYVVARRAKEIAIRIALGAVPTDVVKLMLTQAVGLLALGLAVGVALAVALGRAASSLLFGLEATDPTTLTIGVLTLAMIGSTAAYIPAARAASVSPAVGVRAE
jgi:putative ABC transport system permease protein